MAKNKIYVAGASITNGPLLGWADFLEFEAVDCKLINLGIKGQGNEAIVTSIINQQPESESLVICMLTAVDKFDWYVEGDKFHQLKKEKHPAVPVGTDSGFWSTGSHWPLDKEIYYNKFYSQDYHVARSIQLIISLQAHARQFGYNLIIVFDSPIWSYTEKQLIDYLTAGTELQYNDLLSGPLARVWAPMLLDQYQNIMDTSLIGYCIKNNLLWGNAQATNHPPSSSHYAWYQEYLKPKVRQHIQIDAQDWTNKIKKQDVLWQES